MRESHPPSHSQESWTHAHVCMHVRVCVHACMCECVHALRVRICVCITVYVCACVYMCTCVLHMCSCTCVQVHACTHACLCTCMHVCVWQWEGCSASWLPYLPSQNLIPFHLDGRLFKRTRGAHPLRLFMPQRVSCAHGVSLSRAAVLCPWRLDILGLLLAGGTSSGSHQAVEVRSALRIQSSVMWLGRPSCWLSFPKLGVPFSLKLWTFPSCPFMTTSAPSRPLPLSFRPDAGTSRAVTCLPRCVSLFCFHHFYISTSTVRLFLKAFSCFLLSLSFKADSSPWAPAALAPPTATPAARSPSPSLRCL